MRPEARLAPALLVLTVAGCAGGASAAPVQAPVDVPGVAQPRAPQASCPRASGARTDEESDQRLARAALGDRLSALDDAARAEGAPSGDGQTLVLPDQRHLVVFAGTTPTHAGAGEGDAWAVAALRSECAWSALDLQLDGPSFEVYRTASGSPVLVQTTPEDQCTARVNLYVLGADARVVQERVAVSRGDMDGVCGGPKRRADFVASGGVLERIRVLVTDPEAPAAGETEAEVYAFDATPPFRLARVR